MDKKQIVQIHTHTGVYYHYHIALNVLHLWKQFVVVQTFV